MPEVENKRKTICVFRGMPSYKDELHKKISNIEKKTEKQIHIEKFIEHGINLALAEHGETPPKSSRLQGRYKT